jgi:predicted nucleic acid-binding protein
MIVVDTSALVSLAAVGVFDTVLVEFDVHTTGQVVEELEDTTAYDDHHGQAATAVLDSLEDVTVYEVDDEFTSSRVDSGEGSCLRLVETADAPFLLTDDLRALPELQTLTDARVAISPIVLKALVERDVVERAAALEKLDDLAERRDWLGAPIYRRASDLFRPDG